MAQDGRVQVRQPGAGLDAVLGPKDAVHLLVSTQRLGLPTACVESEHASGPQPFPQRIHPGQGFDLGQDVAGAPARQLGLDPLFPRGQPSFLQPSSLHLGERKLGCHIGQRGSAPQVQRLGEGGRRRVVIAPAGLLTSARHQGIEAKRVEGFGGQPDVVAGWPCHEHPVRPRRPKALAQAGDVDAQGVDGSGRRPAGPQVVDEAVRRHHLVGREQQDGEQGPLPLATKDHRPLPVEDLEGTEDAELHPTPFGTADQLRSRPDAHQASQRGGHRGAHRGCR